MLLRVFRVLLMCNRRLFTRKQLQFAIGRSNGWSICMRLNSELSSIEKKDLVSNLHLILNCSLNEAQILLTLHPLLQKLSLESVCHLVNSLTQNGLTQKQILANPWLMLQTVNNVLPKLDLVVNRIGGLRDATVPLLALPIVVALRVANSWTRDVQAGHPNRIDYLVTQLKCSETTLSQYIHKHTPILIMDFARLQSVMNLLKSNGVSAGNILNDLWIFRHNLDTMAARMVILRQHAVTDLRPWMLRCPEKTLDKFLAKWKERQHVLQPHHDVAEYLAERLSCEAEDVRTELVERNPVLLRTNPIKIKQVLDWLFEKGFTAKQIRKSPRIFEVSMESLQSRFHQLSQCSYRPRNLHILWVEWKLFDRWLRKLKKCTKRGRKGIGDKKLNSNTVLSNK